MNSRTDAVDAKLTLPDSSPRSRAETGNAPLSWDEWQGPGSGSIAELIGRFDAARAALHEEIARLQACFFFADAAEEPAAPQAARDQDERRALRYAQFQSLHAALLRIGEEIAALGLDARTFATLREELARARSNVDESEMEARRLERSLEQRYEELASLAAMLAERETELQDASRELQRERDKVRSMEQSFGWRVSRPVRFCADLVAGLGGARAVARDKALIEKSELFDAAWYLNNYPDVAIRGMNPAEHYLRFGAREGRNPGPGFDSDWYLESNPDVANGKSNPLVHYLRHGAAEGRTPRR